MESLPECVLYQILSYLPLRELCVCCCVCRRWRDVLDNNSDLWDHTLHTDTPQKFHQDPLIQDLHTSKDKLAAFYCAWSTEDHSPNIFVKENKLTLHRNPVAQSSDLARGKKGFSKGLHYWTVTWHGPQLGSSAVVGVATKKASLHSQGYHPLLGREMESWGWDLSEKVLRHAGEVIRTDYPDKDSAVKVSLQGTIGVTLDMTSRTLEFDIDGKCLGIAFRDLPNVALYPAISAVYGNTEVSLVYRGAPLVG